MAWHCYNCGKHLENKGGDTEFCRACSKKMMNYKNPKGDYTVTYEDQLGFPKPVKSFKTLKEAKSYGKKLVEKYEASGSESFDISIEHRGMPILVYGDGWEA